MDWILKLIEMFLKKPALEPAMEEAPTDEKVNEIKDLAPVSEPAALPDIQPEIPVEIPMEIGRKISQAGIDVLKHFEGCKLKAYRDSVGVLTIGYGSTGSHVSEGMNISQTEAEELLKKDLARFEKGVENLVTVTINDNQFSALVVFSYNVGLGNLSKSTLLKKLNAGDYDGAAHEFLKWNKAGGVILLGLTRRRDAEAKLFIS